MTTCKGCRWLAMTWADLRLRQARRSRANCGGPKAKARSAITAPASNTRVGSR